MCGYSPGFLGERASNDSAVVKERIFILYYSTLYIMLPGNLPGAVPTRLEEC